MKTIEEIKKIANQGPFEANWKTLNHFEIPRWFKKAKFGIFIHWGLYSIPAFNNEWYSRNMYRENSEEYRHHIQIYGPHTEFGYKEFIPQFTAEKFDAKEWIQLFKEAGATYFFPVAEHHDGFQMYQSELSNYNAVQMGPHRDILQELKEAGEKEGLVFCTSSHRAEHWFFMGHGKDFPSDVVEPMKKGDFYWPAQPEPDNQALQSTPYPTAEFLEDWLLRTVEIIDRYQPKVLYFDWWIQHESFKEYLQILAAYYYNCGYVWQEEVAICYKHDALMFGSGIVEIERGKFSNAQPFYWQSDTAIARNSWCYTETLDYKDVKEILYDLIEVVSKNGNLLLNVGPKGDGSIAEKDQTLLKKIGEWLKINGEAIYDSKVWRKSGEGPTQLVSGQFQENQPVSYTPEDIRFTVSGESIYAFLMAPAAGGKVLIKSLATSKNQDVPEFHGLIKEVKLLGAFDDVQWEITDEGLVIILPEIIDELPKVCKITIV